MNKIKLHTKNADNKHTIIARGQNSCSLTEEGIKQLGINRKLTTTFFNFETYSDIENSLLELYKNIRKEYSVMLKPKIKEEGYDIKTITIYATDPEMAIWYLKVEHEILLDIVESITEIKIETKNIDYKKLWNNIDD